jgi:glycosyltransferase involved in cell wall biosynthesis
MPPRVSVAIPVYNGENYVAEAIQSILSQDLTDFELIVTDNASTDGTRAICEAFAANDQRVRYVRNRCNLGAAGNFNLGFELSTGEYFKWCAHDDFVSSNFLKEGVRALEASPSAVVAYCRLEFVDLNGDITSQDRNLADMRGMSPGRRFGVLLKAAGFDNAIFGVIRRSALVGTSLHRPYYMSDRALLTELALRGEFVEVPDIILYNRDHPHRSVRLLDRTARVAWQNPAARVKLGLEHLHQLRHQFEIAYRYRKTVPLYQTLPQILLWALHPAQLVRYALELLGVVAPSLRLKLRTIGWQIIASMRRVVGLDPPAK